MICMLYEVSKHKYISCSSLSLRLLLKGEKIKENKQANNILI